MTPGSSKWIVLGSSGIVVLNDWNAIESKNRINRVINIGSFGLPVIIYILVD